MLETILCELARGVKIQDIRTRTGLSQKRFLSEYGSQRDLRSQIRISHLPPEALRYVECSLLGDGCIKAQPSGSGHYIHGTKNKKYAELTYAYLSSYGILMNKSHSYKKNTASWYVADTRSTKAFGLLRERWYPEGIKKVPDDFIWDFDAIDHLIIDDGTVRYRDHVIFWGAKCDYSLSRMLSFLDESNVDWHEIKPTSGLRTIVLKSYQVNFKVPGYEYKWDPVSIQNNIDEILLKKRIQYEKGRSLSRN